MPLADRYKEKGKLRIVKCNNCKHEFASSMKIPKCSKCLAYLE